MHGELGTHKPVMAIFWTLLEPLSEIGPWDARKQALCSDETISRTPSHLWQTARPPLSRNHCLCLVASPSRSLSLSPSFSPRQTKGLERVVPFAGEDSRELILDIVECLTHRQGYWAHCAEC